jgi:hypothetical protein
MPIEDALPLGFSDGPTGFDDPADLHHAGGGADFESPGGDLLLPRSVLGRGSSMGGSRQPGRASALPSGRASSIGGDAPDAGLTAEYEIEYAGAFGGARLNVSYSAAGNSPTPHDFSRSYSKSTEELMEQMTARLRRRAAANFNADVLPSLRGDRRAQAVCFVDLLTLASDRRLRIEQAAPYEDITVGRGPAFELRTEDLPGVAQTIDEDD